MSQFEVILYGTESTPLLVFKGPSRPSKKTASRKPTTKGNAKKSKTSAKATRTALTPKDITGIEQPTPTTQIAVDSGRTLAQDPESV